MARATAAITSSGGLALAVTGDNGVVGVVVEQPQRDLVEPACTAEICVSTSMQ
jgi:hypothetical protein